MAPRAIGLGATQITFVVVTSLATTLGAGAVTSFTVAFTLLQIPIGVIGVPLGVVVLPSLAREAAVGREVDFAGLLTRALRLLVFVMVPIGALLAILREATVALLFDYGRFDAAAQRQTSDALAAFLVGLAAHAMIAVLARSFYARQDTLTPVIAAVGAVVVNTTLAVALVGPLGLPGIALAIAIAAWLEALTLIVILRRRLEHLDLRPLGRVALAAVGGTLVATAAGLAALSVTEGVVGVDPDKPGLILQVGTVGLAFVATYLAISVVLRVPELPSIVGVMVDALRRPRRT
jgi:putative peptidoglycan lipid II flippase